MKFLDLLFSKYSNPMILLNGMIRSGRFHDFCTEFIKIHNEETEEKTLWEYYLHRVFDQSFIEFKESIISSANDQTTSKEEIKTTIRDSMNMLNGFCPS